MGKNIFRHLVTLGNYRKLRKFHRRKLSALKQKGWDLEGYKENYYIFYCCYRKERKFVMKNK